MHMRTFIRYYALHNRKRMSSKCLRLPRINPSEFLDFYFESSTDPDIKLQKVLDTAANIISASYYRIQLKQIFEDLKDRENIQYNDIDVLAVFKLILHLWMVMEKKFVLVSDVPETPMQVQVQAPAQLAVMVENPAGNGIGAVEQIKLINPPPNWREISSTNPSLTYAKGEELFVACVSRSCGAINCLSVIILEKNAMLWESAVISTPLPGDCCNAENAETDKDALAAILSVFREWLSPFINLVNSKGFRPRAPYGVFWNSSSSSSSQSPV